MRFSLQNHKMKDLGSKVGAAEAQMQFVCKWNHSLITRGTKKISFGDLGFVAPCMCERTASVWILKVQCWNCTNWWLHKANRCQLRDPDWVSLVSWWVPRKKKSDFLREKNDPGCSENCRGLRIGWGLMKEDRIKMERGAKKKNGDKCRQTRQRLSGYYRAH